MFWKFNLLTSHIDTLLDKEVSLSHLSLYVLRITWASHAEYQVPKEAHISVNNIFRFSWQLKRFFFSCRMWHFTKSLMKTMFCKNVKHKMPSCLTCKYRQFCSWWQENVGDCFCGRMSLMRLLSTYELQDPMQMQHCHCLLWQSRRMWYDQEWSESAR